MRRSTFDTIHVAVIVLVIIISFVAVDLRRQAQAHASQMQRAILSTELAKVCRVLKCDERVGK